MHAGVVVMFATNPLWVVKTRMQLENTNVTSAAARAAVAKTTLPTSLTFPGAVKSIYAREGMMGFYRGIGPALLLCSHGAVQILAYEELKALWKQGAQKYGALQYGVPAHSETLFTGSAAKLIASAVTYPLQVCCVGHPGLENWLLVNELASLHVHASCTVHRAVMLRGSVPPDVGVSLML